MVSLGEKDPFSRYAHVHAMVENISLFSLRMHYRFFKTPQVGVIGIFFVLLKYKNELELVTSDISVNSVSP